jgi:hypothetical protein
VRPVSPDSDGSLPESSGQRGLFVLQDAKGAPKDQPNTLVGKVYSVVVSPIPLSGLGTLSGRFHLDERWPLIAMRYHFDGSETSGDGDQWMTLFCLVASDVLWSVFQKDWEQMLRDRYPIAPYLHMTDLITGNDPYERCAGWTDEKKRQLVHDAGEVLNAFRKDRLCAAYCTINLSARARLASEGILISDPAAICAENCLYSGLRWTMAENHLEISYLFFDQDEPYLPTIRGRWRAHERRRTKHLVHSFG